MASVYIAIGSNIDAQRNIEHCVDMLKRIWSSSVSFSSLYRTAAMEVTDQDDFLNAAAKIETDMPVEEVHMRLQAIENLLEKDPPFKYGPRTIDLDVLLYDDFVSDEAKLTVPHPRMHQRRFVLEPLADIIDMSESHPVLNKTYDELLKDVQDQNCERETINPW